MRPHHRARALLSNALVALALATLAAAGAHAQGFNYPFADRANPNFNTWWPNTATHPYSGDLGRNYSVYLDNDGRVRYASRALNGATVIDSTLSAYGNEVASATDFLTPKTYAAWTTPWNDPSGWIICRSHPKLGTGNWSAPEVVLPRAVGADSITHVEGISMAVNPNDGTVHIGYIVHTEGAIGGMDYVRVATRQANGTWVNESVANGYDCELLDSNVAVSPGGPVITWFRYYMPWDPAGQKEIHYAFKTAGWTDEFVGLSSGTSNAVTAQSAYPQVAYIGTDLNLTYAYRDPALGWVPTPLKRAIDCTGGISMTENSSGFPVIAYYRDYTDSVRIAIASKSLTGWNYQWVDKPSGAYSPLSVGTYNSSGSTKAQLLYEKYANAPSSALRVYRLATGTLTTNGTKSATPSLEGDDPPIGSPDGADGGSALALRPLGSGVAGPERQLEFELTLPKATSVELSLYDVSGRVIETKRSDLLSAGTQRLRWDARDLASGVFFVRARTAEGGSVTAKVLVVR